MSFNYYKRLRAQKKTKDGVISNKMFRYFQLVVSIEAVLQNRQTVCLVALATDKIIVR